MILVLERGTSKEELDGILSDLGSLGLQANVLGGAEKPLIHITAGRTRKVRRMLRKNDRVQALIPTSGPRIRRQGRRFYPYHFLNWCAVGLVVLGVLVVLAGYFPTGVGEDADTRRPLVDVPVPWYLRAPVAVLGFVPQSARWMGWLLLAAVAALVFSLPLLESKIGAKGRAVTLLVGGLVAIGYVGLTVWGAN